MLAVDFRRRANPFATCYIAPGAAPYRWLDPVDGELRSSDRDSLQWLVSRVAGRRCSAILGPHGSGKSSLVAALEPSLRQRFSAVHRFRLEASKSPWQVLGTLAAVSRFAPGDLWLIDGLETWGGVPARLITLAARSRGICLLATVHRQWPFLPIVWRTELNASFAKRLTSDRLRDWPAHAESLLGSWEDRWRGAAGNLRELWFQLFDEFERLERASCGSQSPLPH